MAVIAAALFSGPVAAQVNCGAQPHDVPIEVQEQLKGDIQGKAQMFTRLLGDAQLQGAVDSTRHELNEKHRDIDQSQLDRYMLWTTCQAILVDPKLTPQEKVEQYLRVYKALRPGSSRAEPPTYPHMIVTESLGLQFRQGDQTVPITRVSDNNEDIMVVRLNRAPFEIILPAQLTSAIDNETVSLMITASADPDLLRLAIAFQSSTDSPLFAPASSMADYTYGSGGLMASNPNHKDEREPIAFNSIVGSQFTVAFEGRRGIYVSTIPIVLYEGFTHSRGPDALRTAPAVYLVCRYDFSDPQPASRWNFDPSKQELIQIDFAD
jgi:hypothetical protein